MTAPILKFDDLPIPSLGIWEPDCLFYYSLLRCEWVRVKRMNITGPCIAMDIDVPEGGKATLFPHKIYKDELEFKMPDTKPATEDESGAADG